MNIYKYIIITHLIMNIIVGPKDSICKNIVNEIIKSEKMIFFKCINPNVKNKHANFFVNE